MTGFGEPNGSKKKGPQQKSQANGNLLLNNAINHHIRGDLKNAEKAYREAIDHGFSNVAVFSNLGTFCQATQCEDKAEI